MILGSMRAENWVICEMIPGKLKPELIDPKKWEIAWQPWLQQLGGREAG